MFCKWWVDFEKPVSKGSLRLDDSLSRQKLILSPFRKSGYQGFGRNVAVHSADADAHPKLPTKGIALLMPELKPAFQKGVAEDVQGGIIVGGADDAGIGINDLLPKVGRVVLGFKDFVIGATKTGGASAELFAL